MNSSHIFISKQISLKKEKYEDEMRKERWIYEKDKRRKMISNER